MQLSLLEPAFEAGFSLAHPALLQIAYESDNC
jgi:hypothetical protein